MIGGLCVVQCIILVPTGLFVGLHILVVGIAMLLFGVSAIWLGQRQFNSFVRLATIAWGVLATLVILAAIAIEPPTARDVGGLIFIGLVLG